MAEDKDSGNIGIKVYSHYFSQSPGCFCNIWALLLATTPFVLMGYLRFFIASWASVPLAQ